MRVKREGVRSQESLLGIEIVVADGSPAFQRVALDEGGEEVGRGENLVIFLGMPTALGAVDDFLGSGVLGDFFERKTGYELNTRRVARDPTLFHLR